jgi:hypothetical protein
MHRASGGSKTTYDTRSRISPLATERWERGGTAQKDKEISWEEGLTFFGIQQPSDHSSKEGENEKA